MSWTGEDIEFLPAPPGYTCERNRKTGTVTYFREVPPGCFCGGPEMPFFVDPYPPNWALLEEPSEPGSAER
ncbi:hypothetical protein GCM10023165_42740 [Variovorax defluvii]|uniref:Uncharacterized protein n=1 Tax=Variovorax defluvii TaxID=913761 RepID=A0ABP8I7L6_9BURK